MGAGPGPVGVAPLRFDVPAPAVTSRTWIPPARFTMLGIDRDFGSAPGWRESPSRLWGYHLHYLDPLRESASFAERLRLLDAWTASQPFGSAPGWEPYPLSLRLVNALEFLVAAGGSSLAQRCDALAMQSWWLEGNLETDLGANHLWKNALALCWSGRCLSGRAADRWRRLGDALATAELAHQLLDDGFHYERSPGYHAVLVDDLIRLERLLRAAGEIDGPFGQTILTARRRALAALVSVLHPDGEIPLFNDTAFGQAPPTAWILERAAEIDPGAVLDGPASGAPAAGLHRLVGDRSTMIFDAGEIGPPEQPGHAHADTLSYELSFEGQRVIVDAGVFDYEASPTRAYARSTRAHNTVEVDGLDQSEMWGAFRVGRRAHPFDVRRAGPGRTDAITAAHDGYVHLPGRPVHRRSVEHLGGDAWRVEDRIEGAGTHVAVSRVRFHPAFEVAAHDGGVLSASNGRVLVRIVADPPGRLEVESGRYFPRFGVEERCAVVRLEAAGPAPLRIAYRLELSTKSSSNRA